MDNRREEKAEEEEKTTFIESSTTQHEIRTVITLILIGLTKFSMPHYHISFTNNHGHLEAAGRTIYISII